MDANAVNTDALREEVDSQPYNTVMLTRADVVAVLDRLAALEAGMRGLVEEWRGESHYTLSFRCGMQLAADELSALLNRPADVEADRND